MTTLTNDQITAGAAVLCDHGQPIGRNAAIEVADAMQGDTPAAFAKRYSELVCENALLKKQLEETKPKCPTCKGNDTTAPCAYPGSGMDGCLRDKRLAAPSPQIAEKVELPPLPVRRQMGNLGPLYDDEQMQQYARDAIAASRSTAGGEPVAILRSSNGDGWDAHMTEHGYQLCGNGLFDGAKLYAAPSLPDVAMPELRAALRDLRKAVSYRAACVIHGDEDKIAFATEKLWEAHEKAGEALAAQPAEVSAGQAGQVATAAVLEEICDMQAKNYGDGMGTHLALIDLCDRARKILAAERAAAPAEQPSAQVKP